MDDDDEYEIPSHELRQHALHAAIVAANGVLLDAGFDLEDDMHTCAILDRAMADTFEGLEAAIDHLN